MNMQALKLNTPPIVIAEDDADDQFLIERILKRIGVQSPLLFFNNGKEALHYLETTDDETFLILSDINMPIMNGLELRQNINANPNLKKKSIPFIFFSTAARQVDVNLAYDMTVQGFFVKESELAAMEDALEIIILYWSKCKHLNSFRHLHED